MAEPNNAGLRTLYGFLLVDDYVEQMTYGYGNGYKVSRRNGRIVNQTRKIGDSPTAETMAQPSTLVPAPSGGRQRKVVTAAAEPYLDRLDDHLLRKVLELLSAKDLLHCMDTAPNRLARVALDVKQRGDLECFYSRSTYTDAVLGFGVHREWHQGRRAGQLRAVVVRLDYLSLDAFVEAVVRRSAWNAPINAFLPLYLNPQHGQRALKALPSCVAHLMSKMSPPSAIRLTAGDVAVPPRQLLTVLSQAMNSLVVEMVRLDKGDVPTHMSDAALKGFAHLHHLLLAVALSPSGTSLVAEARRDVAAFINGGKGGKARHKEACPDLGVLLVELLLVPKEEAPWGRFLPPFLREQLARQVMWVLKPSADTTTSRTSGTRADHVAMPGCNCAGCVAVRQHAAARTPAPRRGQAQRGEQSFDFGVVAGEDPAGDSWHSFERMRTQYESGLTGLRVVQLTCWFGLELARPQTAAGIMQELELVKRSYDECSGAPKACALAAFHAHARAVMGPGSWGKVLGGLRAALRCEMPTDGTRPDPRGLWAATLRQSVIDSWVAGYHDSPRPWGNVDLRQAVPYQPPPAAKPAARTDNDGWRDVKSRRHLEPKSRVSKGPWSNLCAPDPERLVAVKRIFGVPFVDWEGDEKPVMAVSNV